MSAPVEVLPARSVRTWCETCGKADGTVRRTWTETVEGLWDRSSDLCAQCRYELSLTVPIDVEVRS